MENFERQARDARAAAAGEAKRIRNGIADGDTVSIEDFARLAIERLSLPHGVTLSPKVAYRPDPRKLVVDIRLPDASVVPIEKSVKYVRARQTFTVKERSRTEMANLYRGIWPSCRSVLCRPCLRRLTTMY
jgi:hypothetical protein